MNKELVILGVILLISLLGVAIFIYMKDKKKKDSAKDSSKESDQVEKFDISTDPLTNAAYSFVDVNTCPERAPCINNTLYGGLNPQYNEHVSLDDYIKTYENDTDFSNPRQITLASKRYCQLLYPNHIEYFTGCLGYLSFGECEIGTEQELRKKYPETQHKPLFIQ